MRQRPVDANQTTLFIDTQPRPVNRGEAVRRHKFKDRGPDDGGGGDGDACTAAAAAAAIGSGEMTGSRALTLLGVAALMLLAGLYLVRGHHYAHLHRQIEDAYYGYLEAWDRDFSAAFAASRWELRVEGLPQPLPLLPTTTRSKRVSLPVVRPAPPSPSPAPSAGSDPDSNPGHEQQQKPSRDSRYGGYDGGDGGGTERRRRRKRWGAHSVQSSILSFRVEGLMAALHPQPQVPLMDAHRAAHSGLWRPVVPELRRGRAMELRVVDGATGAGSVLELGSVAFTRERSVLAGGEGRCIYEQQGVWQPDATCAVHELLWSLCVKVSRDAASGSFAFNTSLGGGPGCSPSGGWEAGQWRRLDQRRHRVHGRMYLPQSARNATTVVVRHDHDPSILEAEVVRRLTPNMEHQILFHAIGLALCFLSIVLLLSVVAFAAPVLLPRLRAGLGTLRQRVRRRRAGGKASDDEGDFTADGNGGGWRSYNHHHHHSRCFGGDEL